jgi:S1-C subfamily serine protease
VERATRAGAALLAAVLLLAAGGCTATDTPATEQSTEQSTAQSTARGADEGTVPAPVVDFADVVEQVAPSVVTVRTGGGVGSGVVYQDDVVLTNQHVVQDARDVTIDYGDGTSSGGTVLATDRVTDLAVVRTARTGLPVPEYHPELPRPGEPVLAIGSPLGLEGTVTAGIVSALDREIPGSAASSQALVDLIQVDAAISPGNSGGALLDARGRVIGINLAYIPPAAGAVSLGFAIPSATAVDVAEQLLADGSATHSFLGLSLARVTPQIGRQLGVSVQQGALVLGVQPGGPADLAGIRAGDVVVEFDGEPVASIEDLLDLLRDTRPGAEAPVIVARGDGSQELTVMVGSVGG